MEKVNGHHFLFYLPAVINLFFHSHPENTREKEKGGALLMGGEDHEGSHRVWIESVHFH